MRQLTEDPYPRVRALYSFNVELKEKASEWNCAPFGSIGTRMLRSTAETFNLPSSSDGNVVLWTWPDGNVPDDRDGRLMSREEAMEVRQVLNQYLTKYDTTTEEEFEKHRKSQESFLWWDSLRVWRPSGTVAENLSPPVCNCEQCRKFHKLAFATLTNYFDFEKQEKKQIRLALKALT